MSFICLLLYIFCIILRPQEWVLPMIGAPLIDALAIMTLFFLFAERMMTRQPKLVREEQNKMMVLFFIATLLSHLVHTFVGGMVDAFSRFLPNFILYFLTLNAINTPSKYKKGTTALVFAIFLLVFQGMYQLKHGYGWAHQFIYFDNANATPRITWIGIFNDPNDLALIFVVAIGLLLAYAFGRTGIVTRVASFIMIALFVYGVYLTNSRGGVLALMATVYFYFVKRTGKIVIGSIIGATAAAAILSFGPSRTALISVEEASAANRVVIWYQGILMLKSNPLFGRGFDMFMEDLVYTAHNSFVLAAAELGMFGLWCFVGLFFVSFRQLSLVQKKVPEMAGHAYGLQSAIMGFCAAAFFLSRTYVILPYLLVSLAGSLFHASKEYNPELAYKFTTREACLNLFVSIVVLLMVYAVIKVGL